MNLTAKINQHQVKLLLEGITEPVINNNYQCDTCGNIGKFHPNTSMCFICGDDNWTERVDVITREPNKELLEKYLQQMPENSCNSDKEVNHRIADGVLCELLIELGYKELVDKFDELDKWYA